MSALKDLLNSSIADRTVPNVIVFATNKDQSFQYSFAAGWTSAKVDATNITKDAVLAIASQTKLLTAVAVLQAVEQNLASLDDDVADLLPELAAQPILKGYDEEDNPVLEPRNKIITLRHLLLHTSGATYDVFDSNLQKYLTQRGRTPYTGTDVVSRFSYPLVFQPGDSWMYSTGLDWAGLLVERLTKTSLESFMKQHIWDPLGLESMTFFPSLKPGLAALIPELSRRDSDGELHPLDAPLFTTGVTGCFGGYGIYSDMRDYVAVLRSLLAHDGRLLISTSIEELFKPQLTQPQTAAIEEVFASPYGALFTGETLVHGYDHGWAVGGLVFLESYRDNRRKAGSMSWGGSANCWWIIDREEDLAFTFGTQVMALRDQKVKNLISATEKELYAMSQAHKA